MANVKQHSSSSSFPDARLNLSIRIDDAQGVPIVTMGHDVSRTHQLHNLRCFGRSETDMGHQRKLELVTQLAADFQERQAVLAVHV